MLVLKFSSIWFIILLYLSDLCTTLIIKNLAVLILEVVLLFGNKNNALSHFPNEIHVIAIFFWLQILKNRFYVSSNSNNFQMKKVLRSEYN